MNLMSKRKIFLKPGELCFGIPGTNISTVLGSCVAITLWHPVLSIGAMCHFVLPKRPQGEPRDHSFDGRYGDEAIQLLTLGMKLSFQNIRLKYLVVPMYVLGSLIRPIDLSVKRMWLKQ